MNDSARSLQPVPSGGNPGCFVAQGTSAVSSLALLVCFVPHLFVTQQSGTIVAEICDHGRVGGRSNLTTDVKR